MLQNERRHLKEKPEHCNEEQLCAPQLEKAMQQGRPSTAKTKSINQKIVSEESSWADMELCHSGQIPSWSFSGMRESGGYSEGSFLPELSSLCQRKSETDTGLRVEDKSYSA